VAKSKKRNLIDITGDNVYDNQYDDISFVNPSDIKPKLTPKKDEEIDYKPIKKDFIKLDRYVLDIVVPFLNSRCSPGTSILYIELYRMSYGYGKNKAKLDDDLIEKRVSIPKRTLMKYRKELLEYDMIRYIKGHKTRRGEYTVLLPEQSSYFRDYIHKRASQTTNNVGNPSQHNTNIYKDKFYIDIETRVVSFYKSIGYKQTALSRDRVDNGIKILSKLYAEGYEEDTIKNCLEWMPRYCKEKGKELFGIGFISYLIGDYIVLQEKQANRKKSEAEEKRKKDLRNKELEQEQLMMNKFDMLPRNKQTEIITQAQELVDEFLSGSKYKPTQTTEKIIRESYIIELIKGKYTDV